MVLYWAELSSTEVFSKVFVPPFNENGLPCYFMGRYESIVYRRGMRSLLSLVEYLVMGLDGEDVSEVWVILGYQLLHYFHW